jgi:hypothetical protein
MTREKRIKAKCKAFDSKWGTNLRLIDKIGDIYDELLELRKDIYTLCEIIDGSKKK